MEEASGVERPFELFIQIVGGEEIDRSDLDAMARSLQSELEEIPAIKKISSLPSHEAEKGIKGAKGIDIELGKFLLELAIVGVPPLLGFLKDWVLRPGSRPVKIKVKGKSGEIEVEFDPRTIDKKSVSKIALDLQTVVKN